MIQEIIVYIILSYSVYKAVYQIYNTLLPLFSKNKTIKCSGACMGCCSSNNKTQYKKISAKHLNL